MISTQRTSKSFLTWTKFGKKRWDFILRFQMVHMDVWLVSNWLSGTFRTVTEDTTLGGQFIPAGVSLCLKMTPISTECYFQTVLGMQPNVIHKNPKNFENPGDWFLARKIQSFTHCWCEQKRLIQKDGLLKERSPFILMHSLPSREDPETA